MTIDIVTHFARLPGEQAPPAGADHPHHGWVNLLSQQGCNLEQDTLGWVCLVVELTNRFLEERDRPVHQFKVTIHYHCLCSYSNGDPVGDPPVLG